MENVVTFKRSLQHPAGLGVIHCGLTPIRVALWMVSHVM